MASMYFIVDNNRFVSPTRKLRGMCRIMLEKCHKRRKMVLKDVDGDDSEWLCL